MLNHMTVMASIPIGARAGEPAGVHVLEHEVEALARVSVTTLKQTHTCGQT